MEKAVLEGVVKQGANVNGNIYPEMLYIRAIKMIVDKSRLFGLLASTDVHNKDIILDYCPKCGTKLLDATTNI